MTFWGKKKTKKTSGSKLDNNISTDLEKSSRKIVNKINGLKAEKIALAESLSECSYEIKKKSFFKRICQNKKEGMLFGTPKLDKDIKNTSIPKISVDTTIYYPASIHSPSRIYENIHYASPNSSIFDKSHVFERSVDYSSLASPSTSISFTPSVYKINLIDSTHQQRMVDNHVPTVLDASMEILNDSTDMDNIEIVSIKRLCSPALSSDTFQPKDSLTSYTSSLYTRETSLSFVSYADLVNVDYCETSLPVLTLSDNSKIFTQRSDPEYVSLKQTFLGTEVKRLLSNTDNVSNI
ncbi:hypothetical protein T552_03122 [Pneumocystis carinii B80]|uniref:Uncharacterized protein n=1 Tax=Pneumocystis carinii (strain B80) TaxID=1408658 RepID=A0A0W4ZBU9_PNEC8|nr:hypothetical protein T552_03122 [Pneumocystis carinii B80]KTW25849.1 hypothetical protein T552_03122 [Pneumocystis carinii B80]